MTPAETKSATVFPATILTATTNVSNQTVHLLPLEITALHASQSWEFLNVFNVSLVLREFWFFLSKPASAEMVSIRAMESASAVELDVLSAIPPIVFNALPQPPTSPAALPPAAALMDSSSPPLPSGIAEDAPTTPSPAAARFKHLPALPTSLLSMELVFVPQETSSMFSDNACPASLDVPTVILPPLVLPVNLLFCSKTVSVSQDVDQDSTRTDLSALLVHLVVLCARALTSVSSAWLVSSATTDSATITVPPVQSRAQTPQAVLNVILLALPALSIPASVLLARAAVEISSTTNVLKSVQLEPTLSTDHVNIVLTTARAVSDPVLLALPVPTERSSTQELAMINALT